MVPIVWVKRNPLTNFRSVRYACTDAHGLCARTCPIANYFIKDLLWGVYPMYVNGQFCAHIVGDSRLRVRSPLARKVLRLLLDDAATRFGDR